MLIQFFVVVVVVVAAAKLRCRIAIPYSGTRRKLVDSDHTVKTCDSGMTSFRQTNTICTWLLFFGFSFFQFAGTARSPSGWSSSSSPSEHRPAKTEIA